MYIVSLHNGLKPVLVTWLCRYFFHCRSVVWISLILSLRKFSAISMSATSVFKLADIVLLASEIPSRTDLLTTSHDISHNSLGILIIRGSMWKIKLILLLYSLDYILFGWLSLRSLRCYEQYTWELLLSTGCSLTNSNWIFNILSSTCMKHFALIVMHDLCCRFLF